MAEGYVRTSAANANDLLTQILGQASAHGWTVTYQYELGEGDARRGRAGGFHRDGVYVNLASYLAATTTYNGGTGAAAQIIPLSHRGGANFSGWNFGNGTQGYQNPDVVAINVSSGYDSGRRWHHQPGADDIPVDSPTQWNNKFKTIRMMGSAGNVHMFFFDNPAAFFVMVESRPGQFYWLSAGNYESDYLTENTRFYGASLADSNLASGNPVGPIGFDVQAIHPEADPLRSNGWGGFMSTTERGYGPGSSSGVPDGQNVPSYNTRVSIGGPNNDSPSEVQRGYDPLTGRGWPNPIRAYMNRQGGNKSYLGAIPHIYLITTSHFIGGETVSVGGEEYMIFPWNWRASPYDWDATTASYDIWGPWYRNNTRGTGVAVRKPA